MRSLNVKKFYPRFNANKRIYSKISIMVYNFFHQNSAISQILLLCQNVRVKNSRLIYFVIFKNKLCMKRFFWKEQVLEKLFAKKCFVRPSCEFMGQKCLSDIIKNFNQTLSSILQRHLLHFWYPHSFALLLVILNPVT